ncbi:MAG: Transmembrane heme transport protein MmpL11 [uncultured Solirubrobacteraceae bacterium]|uniref:Transmembrane heme transport protein MmpL11 n=1 Tax=uncultured Solirubrobacteraceae bacterium TaxID=1162706 RepID=A0A6J4T2X1_9ACTN|nr:MAG: Transmembrane heme transport protein MmpL11 [uncultured Solirubrobacteraceae bacterium]
MQGFMVRLDGMLRRRRWWVLGAWVVALAVAVPFAAKQSDHLTGGGYGVPGSQSQTVEEAIDADYEAAGRAPLAAVLVPKEGASLRRDLETVRRAVRAEPRVAIRRDVLRRARAAAEAEPRRTLVVPLAVAEKEQDAIDITGSLRERLGLAEEEGRPGVHLVGQTALWSRMQEVAKEDVEKAERSGFPIVALILLVVFGSLAAASLPLALGFVSVVVTGGLIYALSRTMEMSVFVTNMASMIGIGVAVDYSLFVLARYREEIRAGRGPDQARAAALATSGVAVLFSGVTVALSLAGLFLIDTTALRSMAIGAILVVGVAMLASATLLPVLISLLGKRAWARGRFFSRFRMRQGRGDAFWARWTTRVMKRPVLSIVAASAVLLALAAQALDMQTTNGALRQLDPSDETRKGFEAAADVSGPGASSPVKVLANFDNGSVRSDDNRAVLADIRSALRRDRAVARVTQTTPGDNGRSALVLAELETDGEAEAAKDAVYRLRETLPRAAGESVTVSVGGTTAQQEDFRDTVSGSMWKILLFVLGLSYLVLLVLLRSAVLPLKAVVMNLLSVGAAYGVLKLAFGEVDAITPPLVLAVVFGLSMDYEVFLLSRIRERYNATGDTRRAVAEGLSTSARTITSAALIMVGVFMTFVLTGLPSIQQIGLGSAVAIAVDATIVRLVLVPAAMELLGKWNWWLPAPLARVLPDGNLEELRLPAAGARA